MKTRTVLTTALAFATVAQTAFAASTPTTTSKAPATPTTPPSVTTPVASATQPAIVIPKQITILDGFPTISFDGSAGGLRYRDQHTNVDAPQIAELQGLFDLKVTLALDKSNHWQIISETKTGPTFLQPWVDTGVGKHPMNVNGISERYLYGQYVDGKNQIGVGFMPIIPDASANGVFAYASDGWLDGVRVARMGLASWAKRVTVSVGRVDDLNSPAIADRAGGSPNTIIVNVTGDVSKMVSYMAEFTQINPSTADSEQYLRGIVNIATKDVVHFVDKVSIEALAANSDKPLQGFAIGGSKALGKDWSLTGTYSNKRPQLVDGENTKYAPRSYFYREGQQLTLQVQKTIQTSHPIDLQLWLGKLVAGREVVGGPDKALGLINTKGLNVETRARVRF